MKPTTFDFDVVTDAPAPRRRAPEPAEPAPGTDAEGERRQVSPPDRDERATMRAAE
jgi:hypothetical protein